MAKNKKDAADSAAKPKVKRRAKGEESFVEVSSASSDGSKKRSTPLRGSNPDDWEKIFDFCYEKLHLELMKWENTGRFPVLLEGARGFTFANEKGGSPVGSSASMGDDTVKYGKSSKGVVELATGSSAETSDALGMETGWVSKLTELENVQDCVDDAFVELVLQDKEFNTLKAAEKWLRQVMVAYPSNLRNVGLYRLHHASQDVEAQSMDTPMSMSKLN